MSPISLIAAHRLIFLFLNDVTFFFESLFPQLKLISRFFFCCCFLWKSKQRLSVDSARKNISLSRFFCNLPLAKTCFIAFIFFFLGSKKNKNRPPSSHIFFTHTSSRDFLLKLFKRRHGIVYNFIDLYDNDP